MERSSQADLDVGARGELRLPPRARAWGLHGCMRLNYPQALVRGPPPVVVSRPGRDNPSRTVSSWVEVIHEPHADQCPNEEPERDASRRDLPGGCRELPVRG